MNKVSFSEFESVSSKQWKQKIQMDLKGLDYNETLVWQSLEGIHVRPFYHQEDFSETPTPIPGQPKNWKIGQQFFIDKETIANTLIIDVVERGAESVVLTANKEFNYEQVFDKFPYNEASIYFNFGFLDHPFLNELMLFLKKQEATVYYQIDLIGQLTSDGNWFKNLKADHEVLEKLINTSNEDSILSVNSGIYQNAGANIVQQLAYSIAHANEYLNHFQSQKDLKINFQVSVGANYFFEIAKIRALRLIYATLAKTYGFEEVCHIAAVPSKRNKTIYDYNVNMLRTTTECMSAILGGADMICNLPYDSLYHKSNEFGERISRNQLLILKAESYFDLVENPANGSYYIESLTIQLAEKSLELFKEIEKSGGFLSQLKEGLIQKKIKESAHKEQRAFDNGEIVLLGSNKYPNPNDRMKDELQLYPFTKIKPRKTLIEPIIPRRVSEQLEKQRIDHE